MVVFSLKEVVHTKLEQLPSAELFHYLLAANDAVSPPSARAGAIAA